MKERPILFSAPMVRALLAGTKTQTRRIVKITHRTPALDACLQPFDHTQARPNLAVEFCPYGQPGDRLWVRETWGEVYGVGCAGIVYRADYGSDQPEELSRWRPSIHMRRTASRITLEITDVRVQRLQEISEEDAKAEGIDLSRINPLVAMQFNRGNAYEYQKLWESINGDGSWDLNPWVWALTFSRII